TAFEIICQEDAMLRIFALAAASATLLVTAAQAQQSAHPKPPELPNNYQLAEGWPTLPKSMNGGRWGEVIRVPGAGDANFGVFPRCYTRAPPGPATCTGRDATTPPILQFDPAGRLLKSFGVGLFAYPHGFTMDANDNIWASDVNDHE